jgi:hypothetical protein
VDQRCFVFDAAGEVMAFGSEGRRFWSIKLDAPVSGEPVIAGDIVWLVDGEGTLHARALADGAARQRIDLGIVPAGGLRLVEGRTVVASGRGVLQLFTAKVDPNSRP